MNKLDLISTVKVDISAPLNDEDSFGSLLIVGPLPAVKNDGALTPELVGSYTSVKEVEKYGWITEGENADPVGVAAKVAFSQVNPPDKIFIAPLQKETVVDEENPDAEPTEKDETAVAAISRAIDVAGWYAVCPAGVPSSEYQTIAEYVETVKKIFCYTEMLTPSGTVTPSVNQNTNEYIRTIAIYGKENTAQVDSQIPEYNNYLNVAFMSVLLRFTPGSETAAFKKLSLVSPSELTRTEIEGLELNNINYFTSVGGKNITMLGKTISGEWIDVIRFCDWLQNDMQTRVVDLFIANPKITLNDQGITLIQNQMLASLKAGQTAGGISEDEYNEDGEVIPGFSTSVPKASSLTVEQKKSRRLDDFKFKARIASAIHFAEISGSLTYTI